MATGWRLVRPGSHGRRRLPANRWRTYSIGLWGREPGVKPPPHTSAGRPVFLSHVSQYYLPKMRELCRSRGVSFHVLPCPCSAAEPFDGANHVYERPIIYLPAEEFGDGIHVCEPFRDAIRQRLIAEDHLPSDTPSEPLTVRPAGR